jgi:hypothetical protein
VRRHLVSLVVLAIAAAFPALISAGEVQGAESKGDPYAPEVKETVLLSFQDRSPWIPWDSGTLEFDVENPQGVKKHVALKFAGEGHVRLTSLLIVTSDWSVDLASYIATLTTPLPNRSTVGLTWTNTGAIEQLVLNLPYLTERERPCLQMSLVIEATGVIRSTYDTPSESCQP